MACNEDRPLQISSFQKRMTGNMKANTFDATNKLKRVRSQTSAKEQMEIDLRSNSGLIKKIGGDYT